MRRDWVFFTYLFFTGTALIGGLDWIVGHRIIQTGLSDYVTDSGVLILAYGLVRDLILLIGEKASVPPKAPIRMTCLCLESNLGLFLALLGLLVRLIPAPLLISLPEGLVITGASILLVAAHATRDWVVTLTRIPNHRSILPSRKSKNTESR